MKRSAFASTTSSLTIAALLACSVATVAAAEPDLQQLRTQLQERDSLIETLQKKIAQLEGANKVITKEAIPKEKSATETAAPESTTAPPSEIKKDAAKATPAAGVFEVDALSAERALERTLTQSGALLLPAGQAELQMNFGYARTEQQAPMLVSQDGQLGIAELKLRRNDYTTSLSARLGLPFDAQLELTIPYHLIQQTMLVPDTLTQSHESTSSASLLGDITLGIAKTLAREKDWRPDVIGRISLNAGNGTETSDQLSIGAGFKKIQAGLTLLKRQDPVVFTGNFFYEYTLRKNDVQPGDQLGVSLAALLAASPDTSFSVGIDQSYLNKTRIDGASVAGTDQLSSMLMLGATSIINQRMLLSVSLGIGLTKGTPNYTISVALPMRFEGFK